MSDSKLHIVVVGQGQKSKCLIANALAKKPGLFKAFLCRLNLLVGNSTLETSRTVKGHSTKVVITPHIGTPSWTRQKTRIKLMKLKVLVYVEDNDCVDTDHECCILSLLKWFQCHVIRVQYEMGQQTCTDAKYGQLISSRESIILTGVTFNCHDSEKETSEKVKKVFQVISEVIERQDMQFSGAQSVGDQSNVVEKMKEVDEIADTVEDNRVMASVETSGGQEECFSLPSVNQNDWELFSATLNIGTARSNHVRVNVVGNQEAGKTTLVERLQDMDVKCPDYQRRITEGLDINQVTTKCFEKKECGRFWSTNVTGYEKELNYQRMAFAVQKTEKKLADEKRSEQENTAEETGSGLNELDINLGSDFIEEEITQTCPQSSYPEHIDNLGKKMYVRNVKGWRERNEAEHMYISYWDFAGQSTYYSTHQAFMAPSAVYLLVFDLSVSLDTVLKSKLPFQTHLLKHYTVEETLKFWVSSIKAYTRDEENGTAPFIIVGTHRDKVTQEDVEMKFGRIRQALKDVSHVDFISIDNTRDSKTDKHLQSLKDTILDRGLGVIDEEIPAQWIYLENSLLQKKVSANCLTFEEVKALDAKSDKPIRHRDQLLLFLEHEHRRGVLMFFKCGSHELIILDPSILANFFNTLLRQKPNTKIASSFSNKNGIVQKKFVKDVVMDKFGQCTQTVDSVFAILQYLYIVHELKEDLYFLPSLLPHKDEAERLKESQYCEKLRILRLSFENAFIPPSFFHLLLSAMNDKEDGLQIRHKDDMPVLHNLFASFVFYKETIRLDIFWQECKIYFELKNYSKQKLAGSCIWKDMLKMVEEKIKKIMSIYRQENVRYFFEVQCHLHDSAFIKLDGLRKNCETMCPEHHAVTLEELCPDTPMKQQKCNYGTDQYKATHKDLGRLSRHLSSENAKSLAAKLKLQPCNTMADKAVSSWPDNPDMQRFKLLEEWKRQHPDQTAWILLLRLSKWGDRNVDDLANVLNEQVKKHEYDLAKSLLNSVPTEITVAKFSECIGKDWPFLMTELGFTFTNIETEVHEHPHDLGARVRRLLSNWTHERADEATTQTLLDTSSFIGINVKEIESKLKT